MGWRFDQHECSARGKACKRSGTEVWLFSSHAETHPKHCLSNSYALIATATDYDSWRPHSEAVTAAEVFKTLKDNANTARLVIETILDDLNTIVSGDDRATLLEEAGKMRLSIMPRGFVNEEEEDIKKLSFILPEYFHIPWFICLLSCRKTDRASVYCQW